MSNKSSINGGVDARGHDEIKSSRDATYLKMLKFGGSVATFTITNPEDNDAVLVGADAYGEGGHLAPIMCLINGTTIERVAVDDVTYWHVELDEHDILVAEGLPAESYVDGGDSAFFAEAAHHALANADFVVSSPRQPLPPGGDRRTRR